MKRCDKCGKVPIDDILYEPIEGKHEDICFDCLAEKAGVSSERIYVYRDAGGEFLGYDDDIEDVIDYMLDIMEYKEIENE